MSKSAAQLLYGPVLVNESFKLFFCGWDGSTFSNRANEALTSVATQDSDPACGWSCRLAGRAGGSCTEQVCSCDPTPASTQGLFDVPEAEEEAGAALPDFIKKIIFSLTRAYLFRSRESLARPASYGLENPKNFYIASGAGALGAWYLPPSGSSPGLPELGPNHTLLLYLHGNSFDRGLSYRVRLYKLFARLGLHCLTLDYRGYGDSTPVRLNETTVVEDGTAALAWLSRLYQGKAGPRILGTLDQYRLVTL